MKVKLETLNQEVVEAAVLYGLGMLPGDELKTFECKLLDGEAEHVAAFEHVQPATDALLRLGAHEVEPGLIVRSELIKAVAPAHMMASFNAQAEVDPFSQDPGAMVLLRSAAVDWRPTGVPGVQSRTLYLDRERRRVTLMLKLEPGVEFPDHDHPDVEECLILEGDLELGGKKMERLDYMRIPKGGQHGTPRTVGGCLLLVTCGMVA